MTIRGLLSSYSGVDKYLSQEVLSVKVGNTLYSKEYAIIRNLFLDYIRLVKKLHRYL